MVGEADPAPEPLLLADRLATVTVDAKGLVTAWDDGATELFGYQRSQTIGMPLSELVIPVRMRTAHESGLRRAERDGLAPCSTPGWTCRPCIATATSSTSSSW